MANAASNYLENALLNHTLRRNTNGSARSELTQPGSTSTGIAVALFYGSTATVLTNLEAGTITNEVTLGSYARQSVSFGVASSGTSANDSTVTFPTATADYDGQVTCLAIMDAATSGNVLFYGALTVPKTVTTGDTFQVAISNLQVSLA
jgi:hypothetical protein